MRGHVGHHVRGMARNHETYLKHWMASRSGLGLGDVTVTFQQLTTRLNIIMTNKRADAVEDI